MRTGTITKRLGVVLFVVVAIAACDKPAGQGLMTGKARVQDSLRAGRYEAANRLIDSCMAESADSDTYYRWLSIQNMAWFAQMNPDSMVDTSERIHRYLLRHQDDMNPSRRLLWAEWLKARGVYCSVLLGQYDSAVVYTQRAIDMLGRVGDDTEEEADLRLIAMTNMAYYYQQLGQLDKSADVYMEAVTVADSAQHVDQVIPIMLGICTVYTSMGDYVSSRAWWERTKLLLPKMVTADQFIYYNSRGNDYYFQQQYQEARDHFALAASLVRNDEHKSWDYYTALANLGETYVCLGQADSARVMLHQADSFFRKMDFPPFIYYVETSAIELELLEGHTDKALQMVQAGGKEDPVIPASKVLRLKAVEQVMRKVGDYQATYETYREMDKLQDSLQAANIRMQLSARLMQYQHDKRLAEQHHALEKTRADRRLAWVLFAVVLLLTALIGILFVVYRRRHQLSVLKAHQQMVALRMENVRNRITPHFIYNALNHEVLAQMKGEKVDLGVLTQLLRRGVDQAEELQTTLGDELAFVDYYVEVEGRQVDGDFRYVKELADDVDVQAVRLPAMTIQIFAENALKHGLLPMAPAEGEERRLTIRVTREGEATLIEVIDNGRGVREVANRSTRNGLRVVRQTIQLLNERNSRPITFGIGNWQQEGESGYRSWLLLPDDYDYHLTSDTNNPKL